MTLDPAVSPWPGVLSATVICLWMTAIGAPLAHAVFDHRPRPVWRLYAPFLGIVAVLLTTNLAAHIVPGAASAWLGLLAPSAAAAVITWRSGMVHRVSRQSALILAVLAVTSGGIFLFALANRTHVWFADETWHFALAQRMARGEFPPVTPYGVDAGIGYHYGADLLAASVLSATSAPVWTAYYVLLSFMTVALLLAAAGLAWDIGAPLPLAVGCGAVLGFFAGQAHVGLPPYVGSPEDAQGAAWLLARLAPSASAHPKERLAFDWVEQPQWALAAGALLLVAAALEAGVTRRSAALLAAAAGVSALAEAAMLIFSSLALGALTLARLVRLRGPERVLLASALAIAVLLIVFAGGPISDEVFGRGGTTGLVRLEFDPKPEDLAPFGVAGPALIQVGILPLVAIGAFAALRRRSWGLACLTLAGAFGLAEAEVLRSVRPANDDRIFWLATAVAMFAALVGISTLVGGLSRRRRRVAMVAVGLLAVLPTVMPRAISGAQLAIDGLNIGHPAGTRSVERFAVRTQFGSMLAANWDLYEWLARSLPTDARLLTTQPAAVASLAGIASPTSGRDLQSLAQYVTPVYEDALRFLHRDDLAEMGVTNLHVTEDHASVLTPAARRLLEDPRHFELVADRRSVSGARHWVFKVLPGAGVTEVAPSSYRRLRQLVPADTPVSLVGALSLYGRRMVLFNFVDHADLRAPASTDVNRATRAASFDTELGISNQGVVVLPGLIEPVALSLSTDDALWAGYGMRVYRPSAAWSPVERVDSDDARIPDPLRHVCEDADGQLDLRLLGAPGTRMAAGRERMDLTGTPQQVRLSVRDCEALVLSADLDVAPFVQGRAGASASAPMLEPRVAGLGFDGQVDGDRAVVNLWYRNPQRLPFVTGTELRLYESDATGTGPADPDFSRFVRWWKGPLVLSAESQMDRIAFDGRRLEINGTAGAGGASGLKPGSSYLLMLSVAGFDHASGQVEVQQQVPLARVDVTDGNLAYVVFSGIVAVQPSVPGTQGATRLDDHHGWLGVDMDLTPLRASVTDEP